MAATATMPKINERMNSPPFLGSVGSLDASASFPSHTRACALSPRRSIPTARCSRPIGQIERAAGFTHDDTPQTKLDKLDALLGQSATSPHDAALISEMISGGTDESTSRTPLGELLLTIVAGFATFERERNLRLSLALHWGIPHDLLNARLIHGELWQMLFSRYPRRRHLRKLLLHLLMDTARLW
jgi:hypothetical protein